MLTKFQKDFTKLISIIEQRKYNQLTGYSIDVPDNFNWVRDVFEPLIANKYADSNMLELVTDTSSEISTVTYKQGVEKCNQLLNFFRKYDVQQGDDIFIMCGLNEGLWISYLSAIKGGFILIPAASILTINDIVYRFEKASPKVIITDIANAEKMELALLQYNHPVKVKLLLDGEKNGWESYNQIDKEKKEATAADTNKESLVLVFHFRHYRNAKSRCTYTGNISIGAFNNSSMDRIKTRRQTL